MKFNFWSQSLLLIIQNIFEFQHHKTNRVSQKFWKILVGWLVGLLGFYGLSTIVGYLTPNPFLSK